MKTWSWTHDFESYLYWWPITGASVIRDAGKEKNKAIKGESRRRRVTNLILTKLKGYSTQNIKIMSPISPILQQSHCCRATADLQIQWYTRGGIKTKTLGVMMTKKVLYFISFKTLKKTPKKPLILTHHGAFLQFPLFAGLAWQTVVGIRCWWSGREPQ